MRAEIISVGTEIMLGEITDTNARFGTSMVRHPRSVLAPGPTLMPKAQTVWTPGVAAASISYPRFGPAHAKAAPTSGRDLSATTADGVRAIAAAGQNGCEGEGYGRHRAGHRCLHVGESAAV